MIAVIQTPFSNTTSVVSALDRLGLGYYKVDLPEGIRSETTKLILPGVGHAGALMAYLRQARWDSTIRTTTLPFFGICLGYQILFEYLEEGEVEGLGILPGNVVKLPLSPLPHMGWSREVNSQEYYYFVHSYGVLSSPCETHRLTGETSVITRAEFKNYRGTQFHPERSGAAGEKLLKEYLC